MEIATVIGTCDNCGRKDMILRNGNGWGCVYCRHMNTDLFTQVGINRHDVDLMLNGKHVFKLRDEDPTLVYCIRCSKEFNNVSGNWPNFEHQDCPYGKLEP